MLFRKATIYYLTFHMLNVKIYNDGARYTLNERTFFLFHYTLLYKHNR